MNVLNFEPYAKALARAGVVTGSARGFWGGITSDGDIVVTVWQDDSKEGYRIWRPKTRHGNLLDAWEMGCIESEATVKVILLRKKPSNDPNRDKIHSAKLMEGRWKITKVDDDVAYVEPVQK